MGSGGKQLTRKIGHAAVLTGKPMQELDALTLSNSMFGLASAVLMWIAFLPPASYRRWIESRARAAVTASRSAG